MKICLINHLWDAQPRSGAEQAVATLAAGLRAAGHDVFFIATCPSGQAPQVPAGEQVIFLPGAYGPHAAWPAWRRLLWVIGGLIDPRTYYRIRAILRREKAELVWTHNLLGFGYLTLRLGRHFRHIHTIHDIQLLHPSGLLIRGQEGMVRSFFARTYQFFIKRLLATATRIVSPSRWLLELHAASGYFAGNGCIVQANPVTAALTGGGTNDPTRRPAKNFLYVGQVEEHKGVALLLQAFAQLTDPDARLDVIGDGRLLPELRSAAADPRICFLGRRTASEVRAAMRAAGCLVVPSLCYENQPTVILEAFACGLPVIASDFGGTKELLGEERLLFVPTPAALADKLVWAGERPEELALLNAAARGRLSALSPQDYGQKILAWVTEGKG